MSTLEYIGPTVYSTKSTGRWQFLMQGMYLTVPTKWDWDMGFRISKRAIPEITKVLAEEGVVLNDRDRAQVFKLFDINLILEISPKTARSKNIIKTTEVYRKTCQSE